MSRNRIAATQRRPFPVLPEWAGYIIAPVLQVLVTAVLVHMVLWFPISSHPFAHIVVVMLAAYLFGAGPAALAYLVGLIAFGYSTTYPTPFTWTREAFSVYLAGMTAYAVGAAIVGLLTLSIRRYQTRIEAIAEELESQRALLDTFAQNVPIGLALHDRETRHIIANEALARFLGLSLQDLRGKTVWEALPSELASEAAGAVGSVFLTGEPVVWQEISVYLGGERHFRVEHHPVRTGEGRMVGVGVVVVDITEQVEARKKLERIYLHERHIADTLQSSLVGVPPPRIGAFEFESYYRAGMEEARVGGDFHDVFLMGGDKIGIVIGDVSGKGLAAAVQVAMVKYTLRSRAYESDSPGRIMEQANLVAARGSNGDGFITVFFGVLDLSRHTLTYANAGHSPVILWKSDGKRATSLDLTGPVIGISENVQYGEETVHLNSGDELLLGTDGLYEVKCGGEYLEMSGLAELYTDLKQTGAMSAEALVERVRDHCANPLRDDVAVLRVEVTDNPH